VSDHSIAARLHRKRLSKLNPSLCGCVEQFEDRALLGVIWLATVAGRRADPLVAVSD
jgi:hypothetical protein